MAEEGSEPTALPDRDRRLYDGVLAGEETALARTISRIEDRRPGYRRLVGALHRAASGVPVAGITGRAGSGKSTLVDGLAAACVDRGESVGVIAVDPSSPYSGGAVLGDRIRMVDSEDVFVRSMSARGTLGGLAAATVDAVTAMDAFGVDRIFIETVGAGQNEVEIVRVADTVAVLVPPESGDHVQMLKAGLLEVGDVFVVNKADLAGADRTVASLEQMLTERRETGPDGTTAWDPPVLETVATQSDGIDTVLDTLDAHLRHLQETGTRDRERRRRHATAIRDLLRRDAGRVIERELLGADGIEALAERVADRDTDRYEVVADLLGPLEACLEDRETEALAATEPDER